METCLKTYVFIVTTTELDWNDTIQTPKIKRERVNYFGGVEPDQVERVKIERRVRAVKERPGSELSGGKTRKYDSR